MKNYRYVAEVASSMERAVRRMPPVLNLPGRIALPSNSQEINKYVECLLTPAEERICATATD